MSDQGDLRGTPSEAALTAAAAKLDTMLRATDPVTPQSEIAEQNKRCAAIAEKCMQEASRGETA